MRKILLLILLIMLLAACGSAEDPGPLTNTVPEEDQVPAEETAPEDSAEISEEVTQETLERDPRVDETISISSDPMEAGVVRSRDWTKGTEDPLVTIIEYGDFQ